MSTYPTPPPTSSPKHSQQEMPSQSYDRPFRPFTPEGKLPAQETYWKEGYSAPSSPKHWDNGSKPLAQDPNASRYSIPPRRQSSPIQTTSFRPLGGPQFGYNSAAEQPYFPPPPRAEQRKFSRPGSPDVRPGLPNGRPGSPNARPGSPNARPGSPSARPGSPSARPGSPSARPGSPNARLRSPKPIYFSPTNRIPSPYNASRPQPRPGFIKRMWDKLEAWVTRFMVWASKNPIKAGLISFIPVIAAAGLVKGVGKIAGLFGKGIKSGFNLKGLSSLGKDFGKNKEGKWDYGLDEFAGFGGTKAGPLDGFMKILHMLMDHWCKLTPSAIPRTASILLGLYFLETGKKV